MKKIYCKKVLLYSIILLIICASITPIISANIFNNKFSFLDSADEDFDERIETLMKKAHMPSLVACIVKNNTVKFSKEYGYADLRPLHKKKATTDTVYNIGSITKTYAAIAIMQLNESGLIGLDDNVSKYLYFDLKNPKYPDINITPRMLLSHQSSINNDSNLTFIQLYLGVINKDNLNEYYIPNGKFYHSKVWNDYPPGEGVEYATLGINLIGYIVEKITNQSYADYCKEHIFVPLKMYNTSFYPSDFDKDKIARPYLWYFGFYFPAPQIKSRGTPSPGGGSFSTISDLSHYLIMRTNDGVYDGVRILSKESVDEIHKVQYPDYNDGDVIHGLGWYQHDLLEGGPYGGHGGATGGYRAEMRMRNSDKVGVIYFWNQIRYFLYTTDNLPPEELEAQWEIEKELFDKADEY